MEKPKLRDLRPADYRICGDCLKAVGLRPIGSVSGDRAPCDWCAAPGGAQWIVDAADVRALSDAALATAYRRALKVRADVACAAPDGELADEARAAIGRVVLRPFSGERRP